MLGLTLSMPYTPQMSEEAVQVTHSLRERPSTPASEDEARLRHLSEVPMGCLPPGGGPCEVEPERCQCPLGCDGAAPRFAPWSWEPFCDECELCGAPPSSGGNHVCTCASSACGGRRCMGLAQAVGELGSTATIVEHDSIRTDVCTECVTGTVTQSTNPQPGASSPYDVTAPQAASQGTLGLPRGREEPARETEDRIDL